MTDGTQENKPSATNVSSEGGASDGSVAKQINFEEEGPGLVGVALSSTKSRIRDLDSDRTIPKEEHDLLRLYLTREREKLTLKLRVFGEAEKVKALESAIRPNNAQKELEKSQSELKKATAALENLCRDDAKWSTHEPFARKYRRVTGRFPLLGSLEGTAPHPYAARREHSVRRGERLGTRGFGEKRRTVGGARRENHRIRQARFGSTGPGRAH